MSKIICDVCGTRYPESADQCPICGCAHAVGAKTVADSVIMEDFRVETYEKVRGGRFSKSNVRKRNKNVVRYEMQAEKAGNNDEEAVVAAPRKSRRASDVIINILLVLVIIALLLVSAYIFVENFLPDIMDKVAPTTEPTVVETTEAPTEAPTEEPTVPCTGLILANGSTEVVMTEIGQSWLLNVESVPADCTDEMVFTSSNEAVATVDAQGTIVSVGEGEAVITVTCGAETMEFNVVCVLVVETVPPTEAPTEAPTEPPLKNVTLQVDRTDMTFRQINQQTQMKLYNGLSLDEVTWTSKNESIIKVSNTGFVTCVGWGTTRIVVTYGDQTVEIICRCVPPTPETTPATTPEGEAPSATEAPAATEAPSTDNSQDDVQAVG